MYGKYIYGKYTDEGGAGAQQLADVISDFKYMGQPTPHYPSNDL